MPCLKKACSFLNFEHVVLLMQENSMCYSFTTTVTDDCFLLNSLAVFCLPSQF